MHEHIHTHSLLKNKKDGDGQRVRKETAKTEKQFASKEEERGSPGLTFCASFWAAANILAADSRN